MSADPAELSAADIDSLLAELDLINHRFRVLADQAGVLSTQALQEAQKVGKLRKQYAIKTGREN